ncbi:MAG: 50S ribosomal protein L30 [Firmicutes bacterium]|nr:50S ribosomal protein L30 [Bacillota bacterium]MBQ6809837.1 50S ribosomal protein L30 [Bacillota bacterium]MBR5329250.1 50S ribosomal protein L30 [Bacillota bacterium]
MAKIKITLVKSVIGYSEQQRRTVRSLGLTKTGRSVIQNDTPDILGKVKSVNHLVKVETVED